jgi:large subunit ribosomal protein L18
LKVLENMVVCDKKMKKTKSNINQRDRRHKRIRAKISGATKIPRLSVFKSNRYISAQLIDDEKGITLVAVHSKDAKGKTLMEKSSFVGRDIAGKAVAKKINKVVFDRGGFLYTGCVKALADGAREGGITF